MEITKEAILAKGYIEQLPFSYVKGDIVIFSWVFGPSQKIAYTLTEKGKKDREIKHIEDIP